MGTGIDSRLTHLLNLLQEAKIYDLEQLRFQGMPVFPTARPGFFYGLFRRHHESYAKEGGRRTGASGVIFMMDQTGTHVDAPCHQAWDLKLFDGTEVEASVETSLGFKKHAAETIPPILRRGLLLDVARLKRKEVLPAGYLIS